MQVLSLLGPLQIRFGQHSADFPCDGRNFREIIGQKDCPNQRSHDTKGQDCDCDKVRSGQAGIPIKDAPNGQNANQHGRPNGHHEGRVALCRLHPVQYKVCVLSNRIGKLSVGCRALVECFNDLDTVDILHRGGTHVLACLDHRTILFRILFHLCHIAQYSNRNRNQRYQRHTPVQSKEITHDSKWNQQVRCHLRDNVGQRDLHLLHALHHGRFQAARRGIGQVPHGNAGQLIRYGPPQF